MKTMPSVLLVVLSLFLVACRFGVTSPTPTTTPRPTSTSTVTATPSVTEMHMALEPVEVTAGWLLDHVLAHLAGRTPSVEDRLRVVCGHLNVLHAELVALAAEALETGCW